MVSIASRGEIANPCIPAFWKSSAQNHCAHVCPRVRRSHSYNTPEDYCKLIFHCAAWAGTVTSENNISSFLVDIRLMRRNTAPGQFVTLGTNIQSRGVRMGFRVSIGSHPARRHIWSCWLIGFHLTHLDWAFVARASSSRASIDIFPPFQAKRCPAWPPGGRARRTTSWAS